MHGTAAAVMQTIPPTVNVGTPSSNKPVMPRMVEAGLMSAKYAMHGSAVTVMQTVPLTFKVISPSLNKPVRP